ncbi:hypothetical protein ACNJC6_01981 [Acinetobacter johnsonii]|uniref:Uncharacterized protein n=1 Tax=Acinetobacter johnsonii TaxID=40214 RepID=A0A1R7QDK6_ACIJO|nr:hypothetical protein ACNJC6_01981 [Acinetobacter johnsonii]
MYFLDKASISKPFRTSCFKTAAFQVFDAHLAGLEYLDKSRLARTVLALMIIGPEFAQGVASKYDAILIMFLLPHAPSGCL